MGLGLDKDGGKTLMGTGSKSRSRVPHTPASVEARAGDGRGRGCALPCGSLSTQGLHRRRPGGTGVRPQRAAFKYWPEPLPRVPAASLVALGDNQLGLRSFLLCGEVGFWPEPGAP